MKMRRGNGMWAEPDFPKRGWTCIDIEDTGPGALHLCRMCLAQQCRYVHSMTHPIFPGEPLRTGCVCAGWLEGDVEGAMARENTFKAGIATRASERLRFLDSEWRRRPGGGGDYFKCRDGILATITPRGTQGPGPGAFTGMLQYERTGWVKRGTVSFASRSELREAMLNVIDELRADPPWAEDVARLDAAEAARVERAERQAETDAKLVAAYRQMMKDRTAAAAEMIAAARQAFHPPGPR